LGAAVLLTFSSFSPEHDPEKWDPVFG
jgi:hypothetical protein